MRISELLKSVAKWIENPNNELFLLAEYDDASLKIVAESCLQAAEILKIASQELEEIEPPVESLLTPENIQEIATLASALDGSGDKKLIRQASVLDELLMTIAADPKESERYQRKEDQRIIDLKKKYDEPRKELNKMNGIEESLKAIDKSGYTKQPVIESHPLNSRYCPDHFGAQLHRIGDHLDKCSLDGKVYDYENGYTLLDGTKVKGGLVSNQTISNLEVPFYSIFDDRQGRLSGGKA